MKDTELVANAVIILFVNDLDEKVYQLSEWVFPDWVAGLSQNAEEFSEKITINRYETAKEVRSPADVSEDWQEGTDDDACDQSLTDAVSYCKQASI